MLEIGLALTLPPPLRPTSASCCATAARSPRRTVDVRRPLRSAVGLFRSKWWTLGYVVAAVAYALHVGALALAPLSLVQAVLAGGLVLLGVIAERWFGFQLGRREWTGVVLASVGLAFLTLTAGGETGGSSSDYSLAAMLAWESALVGIGTLLILAHRTQRHDSRKGILLGVAAGLLFTVSHVAVKARDRHAATVCVNATPVRA